MVFVAPSKTEQNSVEACFLSRKVQINVYALYVYHYRCNDKIATLAIYVYCRLKIVQEQAQSMIEY